MNVRENIAPGGRKLAVVITTEHDGYSVISAIHQQKYPRRQGGVRFVQQGSLEELAHLAHGMTEKAAAARIPIDGMKAMVVCPSGAPDNPELRARMVACHIKQAITVDPEMVFGPDMGCPEIVLDHVASTYGLAKNVTGLTRQYGGLDIDGNGLTAHGVFAAIEAAVPTLIGARITIQGFGAVGAPLARLLHDAGACVIGVSNAQGMVVDEHGIDIPLLLSFWREHFDQSLRLFAENTGCAFNADPQQLLRLRSDVFVPAARTSILGMHAELDELRPENPAATSIENFIATTGVTLIAEAANHPLSFQAEDYAAAQGVAVLPDIIINCGGMIGCCYEYDNRERLLADPIEYARALQECRAEIRETVIRNVKGLVEEGLSAARLRDRVVPREVPQF